MDIPVVEFGVLKSNISLILMTWSALNGGSVWELYLLRVIILIMRF